VAALDAHQRGELVVAMRGDDVGGREGHPHLVGMLRRLLVDGVDQLQRPPGVMIFVEVGLDPDGEELRAEVALVRGVEVQLPAVERIGQVEVLVDETLRRVGVGVDDDGGAVELTGRLRGSSRFAYAVRL
jgi:hypothetical protein